MGLDGRGLQSKIESKQIQTQAAFIVLALGLVISSVAWRYTEQRVGGDTAGKFQSKVAQAVDAIDRRFQDNVSLLLGLKGLFDASDKVDRDDFRDYLSSVDVKQRFPGLRAVSFIRHVPLSRKAAFEAGVRRDTSINPRGYPNFAIKPPGDRDEYLVVTYLEPMSGAFGFDIFSEPTRLPDIERARDSGQPTATGTIVLVGDPQKQVSLALRVPIYRKGMPVATVAQRRAAFEGFVASTIRINDLMNSLLATQLSSDFDLVIHDFGPDTDDKLESPSR